jgi:hypothetical protein
MKSPPWRAHQTMLAFVRLSNIAGGNPSGGPRVKAASSIDKELRKIPFDRPGSHNSLGFAFEKPVKRMSCGAIDIDLAEHGKCHILGSRTKSRDFGGVALFLGAELITRIA